jgi:hypothetical protein
MLYKILLTSYQERIVVSPSDNWSIFNRRVTIYAHRLDQVEEVWRPLRKGQQVRWAVCQYVLEGNNDGHYVLWRLLEKIAFYLLQNKNKITSKKSEGQTCSHSTTLRVKALKKTTTLKLFYVLFYRPMKVLEDISGSI